MTPTYSFSTVGLMLCTSVNDISFMPAGQSLIAHVHTLSEACPLIAVVHGEKPLRPRAQLGLLQSARSNGISGFEGDSDTH